MTNLAASSKQLAGDPLTNSVTPRVRKKGKGRNEEEQDEDNDDEEVMVEVVKVVVFFVEIPMILILVKKILMFYNLALEQHVLLT